jgi:acyl-CoA synthetase (NDP forming)
VKVALVHLDATDQLERVVDAIRATAADTEDDIREMQEEEAMTRQALDLLGSRRNDAYETALAALREDTQAWWADTLERSAFRLRHILRF